MTTLFLHYFIPSNAMKLQLPSLCGGVENVIMIPLHPSHASRSKEMTTTLSLHTHNKDENETTTMSLQPYCSFTANDMNMMHTQPSHDSASN